MKGQVGESEEKYGKRAENVKDTFTCEVIVLFLCILNIFLLINLIVKLIF